MPSPAKHIRYFFEWLALAAAFRVIPAIPRGVLRVVAPILGTLAFFVHGDGRRTSFANLSAAFPGRFTEAETERIVRKCYRSWAQTYLDQFWTKRLTAENHRDYFTYDFEDPTAFDAVRESGAIWMMPHYGNFEWGAESLSFFGIRYTAIAQDFKNPRLTAIFIKNREHLGHQIIPQEKSMLKLLRVLNKGGHAAFLPDLTVPPGQAATVIEVFGLKVSVTVLGAFLVKRTELPVISGYVLPLENGRYLGYCFAPLRFSADATVQEIAQACWDKVEPVIAARPEHWLWMYKHFRFRPMEGGERYPAYSNTSKAFEKLVATAGEKTVTK